MRFVALLLLSSLAVAQPSILKNFAGQSGSGAETTANITVSANDLGQTLQCSNRGVYGADSNGAQIFSTALSTFMTNAGATYTSTLDPRCTYNHFIQRFIFVCSCNSDTIIVSSGKDLTTATWKFVNIGLQTGDITMNPTYDALRTYVTFLHKNSSPAVYETTVVPSADLAWTGGGSPSLANKTTLDSMTFNLRGCIDPNASKLNTDPYYLVGRDGPFQNGTDIVFNWLVDSIAGNTPSATIGTTVASSFLYNTPVAISQTGGSNIKGTESHQVNNCIRVGNLLYTVLGSGPSAAAGETHNIALWAVINVPALTMSQQGKIVLSTTDVSFPSIGADASGNIIVTATCGSSTTHPSSCYFYHAAADSAGVMHGPNILTTGTQIYACSLSSVPLSWGTYSMTYVDPTDATKLWSISELANSASDCAWGVNIVQSAFSVPLPPAGSKMQGSFRFSGTIR